MINQNYIKQSSMNLLDYQNIPFRNKPYQNWIKCFIIHFIIYFENMNENK